MNKPFKVYGNYGYADEALLEEFELQSEAERFLDGYTHNGEDMGGYEVVEVSSFNEDGSYEVHKVYFEPEAFWDDADSVDEYLA